MMRVEDIMVREVRCCKASDSLNRAAQLMWENDCGCISVVDDRSKVIAMLTDRDICMAAYTQGAALDGMPVSSAMSREVFFCQPGDGLLAAQRVMRKHRVRRLPVIDAEKLAGIISLNDTARALARTAAGRGQVARTLAAICTPRENEAQARARKPREGRKKALPRGLMPSRTSPKRVSG